MELLPLIPPLSLRTVCSSNRIIDHPRFFCRGVNSLRLPWDVFTGYLGKELKGLATPFFLFPYYLCELPVSFALTVQVRGSHLRRVFAHFIRKRTVVPFLKSPAHTILHIRLCLPSSSGQPLSGLSWYICAFHRHIFSCTHRLFAYSGSGEVRSKIVHLLLLARDSYCFCSGERCFYPLYFSHQDRFFALMLGFISSFQALLWKSIQATCFGWILFLGAASLMDRSARLSFFQLTVHFFELRHLRLQELPFSPQY